MQAELSVRDDVRNGVPVISVDYTADHFQSPSSASSFSSEILKHYTAALAKNARVKSCVVEIRADVAGSSLIRGLFDLYRMVRHNKGQVVCVGFPADYLPSLTSLGLLDQASFSLGSDTSSAISRLQTSTN
jgi:hypothetical protein